MVGVLVVCGERGLGGEVEQVKQSPIVHRELEF